jgi:RNA polymerase sigma-70 factor (ECF subfamily)
VRTDRELMEALQDGDARSLDALHSRHSGRLVGWLTRRTRDHHAAEDVAQEVWLSVHRHRDRWRPESGAFSTWLYTIARNALIDHIRARSRRRLVLLDREPLIRVDDTTVERLTLRKAQELIPPDHAVAFNLGGVEGLDHNEMARVMGVSPDCARARLSRATRALREIISAPR